MSGQGRAGGSASEPRKARASTGSQLQPSASGSSSASASRSPTKGTSKRGRKSTTSVAESNVPDRPRVPSGSASVGRPSVGRRSLIPPPTPSRAAEDSMVSNSAMDMTEIGGAGPVLATPSVRGRGSLAPRRSVLPGNTTSAGDDMSMSMSMASIYAPGGGRRSLSQPPPTSVIRRQLRQAAAGTPSGPYPTTSTPRRQLPTTALLASAGRDGGGETPRRGNAAVTPGGSAARSAIASEVRRRTRERASMLAGGGADISNTTNPLVQLARTPLGPGAAGEDSRLSFGGASVHRSAPRSGLRRGAAGGAGDGATSLARGRLLSRTRGIAGWGAGRVESPFDVLSKLARAPGFYVAASEQSMAAERAGQRATVPSARNSLADEEPDRADAQARRSAGSAASRSRSVLRPGESVPGELTRDESDMDLLQDDDELEQEGDAAADDGEAGLARRHQLLRQQRFSAGSALFDTPDGKGRASDIGGRSAADLSRPSFLNDNLSAGGLSALGRSRVLHDRTVDMDMTGVLGAGAGAVGDDEDEERVMSMLADVTRESLFGQQRLSVPGRLGGDEAEDDAQPADQAEDVFDDAGVAVERRSRAMSEPFGAEAQDLSNVYDYDDQMAPLDDDMPSFAEQSLRDDSRGDADATVLAPHAGDETAATSRPQDDGYSTMTESVVDSEEEDAAPGKIKTKSRVVLKQRIIRKKKIRISPHTGKEVPSLPASLTKAWFNSFVMPASSGAGTKAGKYKIEKTAMDAVEDASHAFFAQFAQEISAQAEASGRSSTINEQDVIAVLKDHGHITASTSLPSLIRKHLPREIADLMTVTSSSGSGSKKRKRSKVEEAEESKASDYVRSDKGKGKGKEKATVKMPYKTGSSSKAKPAKR